MLLENTRNSDALFILEELNLEFGRTESTNINFSLMIIEYLCKMKRCFLFTIINYQKVIKEDKEIASEQNYDEDLKEI